MNKKGLKKTYRIFSIIAVVFLILDVFIFNIFYEFNDIPAYQMADQYNDIVCEGDGYYLVRKYPSDLELQIKNNRYNYDYYVAVSYGVIGPEGDWTIPMGQANAITDSMEFVNGGFFEYIGEGLFLFYKNENYSSEIYKGCVINIEKNDFFMVGSFQDDKIDRYDYDRLLTIAHRKYGW